MTKTGRVLCFFFGFERRNLVDDFLVDRFDGNQIAVQAHAESYHSEVEEYTQWKDYGRKDVLPFRFKRTCVSLGQENRVVVYLGQDELVASVGQVFDYSLENLGDVLDGVVWLVFEEYLDRTWQSLEIMSL